MLRYELPCAVGGDPAAIDRLLGTEFLLTNGLGGFAMGTAIGVPTRRYHGLLVAATNPPVGRVVVLHSIVERLVVADPAGDRRCTDLSSYEFLDGDRRRVLHPGGHDLVQKFTCEDRVLQSDTGGCGCRRVRWRSTVSDVGIGRIEIVRELVVDQGTNSCEVRYGVTPLDRESWPDDTTVELLLRPMTPLRDFHSLRRRHECDRYTVSSAAPGAASIGIDALALALSTKDGSFVANSQWWYGVFYRAEADRGQDCLEDLFSPGEFVVPLKPAAKSVCAQACVRAELVAPSVVAPSTSRRKHTDASPGDGVASSSDTDGVPMLRLRSAARDFVVSRTASIRDRDGRVAQPSADRGVSVIAGYPWFSDWGRDTFISLPGLMLHEGRFEEAAKTLETFAAAERSGLIPNDFSDQTGEPEYNTVDASLWFIHAACEHARLSRSDAILRGGVGRACLSIIEHYRRGDAGGAELAPTFNICMDPFDKLIMAGTESTQLTWMDARRDGVTFTPRHGKPVEINALWYNALCSLRDGFTAIQPTVSANLRDLARAVQVSFTRAFWSGQSGGGASGARAESAGFLFDCLTPAQIDGRAAWMPAAEIRPNQLFAVSLPHSPLSRAQQRAVVSTIRDRLLTPMGVRTLDPSDPRYRGRYEGRLFDRDAAYHQGTAWPWLLGVYAMAALRAGEFSREARDEAARVLDPILAEMDPSAATRPGCFGQIAEVYDGDDPQRPSGCPAQAWSVAVILEAMHTLHTGRAE